VSDRPFVDVDVSSHVMFILFFISKSFHHMFLIFPSLSILHRQVDVVSVIRVQLLLLLLDELLLD